MYLSRHTFTLSILAAAMLSVYQAYAAEGEGEDEYDEYLIDVDPLIRPSSNFSIGLGHYDGDREQFGVYDGVQDTETVLLLDGEVNTRDEDTGTWTRARIRNLGYDDREAMVGYERQGDWGVELQYNELPRLAPYNINTGLQGVGTESATISNPAITPGTGNDVRAGTERESVMLALFKSLSPNLRFDVDFRNEDKHGERHWGRGGQPEFMLEPVDWTTRQIDMRLSYLGERFQLAGGYYGSWFSNANSLVDTIRAGDDASDIDNHIYLSLPLDNEAHQFFVDGGYSVTNTTRATFKASYTRAIQDEHIPTSDIFGLADPVAPNKLDGEVNTTLLQANLTARPMPNLNLLASLRYHDVDDQTPAWLVVTGDSEVHSTPLSYETLSGKLEGVYRFGVGLSLIAGIDTKDQDRTVPYGSDLDPVDGLDDERYVPFRAEIDETTYRVQLRRGLSETVNGSIAYAHSERDGSDFADAVHAIGNINPINIADRDRDKWRLTVDWVPTERLNLQFNLENAKDDYQGGPDQYGLLEGKASLYSVDADISVSRDWHVTAWFAQDRSEAEQLGGRFDRFTEAHEIDRQSKLEDKGTSAGLGLRGRPNSRLTVGADLQWSRSKSQFDDTVIPIGEGGDEDIGYPDNSFPIDDITNRMNSISLFGEYALSKNVDVRLDVAHERWRTDDWSWQFADGSPYVFGSDFDGTQIDQNYKQSDTFVGVRYIYRF